MNLVDLKGQLLTRHANLTTTLAETRRQLLLAEGQAKAAQSAVDTTHGALQATAHALAAVESAMKAPPPAA